MKTDWQLDIKNRQYPSAYNYAKQIAAVSSGDWQAKVYSEISRPDNHDDPSTAYLRRDDGVTIRLDYNCSHSDPGKIEFSYRLPSRTVLIDGVWKTQQRERRGDDLTGDKINIGTGKLPSKMFAEMLRRLMPYAVAQHLKDVEFFAKQDATLKREQDAVAAFIEQFTDAGFEPVKGGNGVWFVRGGKASADMNDGGTIQINIGTSDTAKAAAIVKAIELIMTGKQVAEVQPEPEQLAYKYARIQPQERLPLFEME